MAKVPVERKDIEWKEEVEKSAREKPTKGVGMTEEKEIFFE